MKNYGSNIPMAREIVAKVASQVPPEQRAELERALGMMTRRQPARRAPTQYSGALNEYQRNQIDALVKTNLSQQDIAVRVGTNAGRVSEYINGVI